MFNRIPLTPFYPLTLLAIPFFGMQFTDQVNWSLFDFILMGGMLLSLGFGIHLISLRTKTYKQKAIFISVVVLLFLFIWGELAVGIIGSPFAGD
jgi:hypothetical protein|tara:strand:- start:1052 stop:1333 length:282 start_codon:yes stop_codon:yes gene_type:complete